MIMNDLRATDYWCWYFYFSVWPNKTVLSEDKKTVLLSVFPVFQASSSPQQFHYFPESSSVIWQLYPYRHPWLSPQSCDQHPWCWNCHWTRCRTWIGFKYFDFQYLKILLVFFILININNFQEPKSVILDNIFWVNPLHKG